MSRVLNNWITSEVMASNRNPELNENAPGSIPKKKVYPNVRLPQMPSDTSSTEQSAHNPALTKGPPVQTEPQIWDPEERAQKLASYAYAIKREKPGWDFTRCWNQAVSEHPELIGTSDGMSKTAEVSESGVLSVTNAISASYTEIGQVRF